MIEDRLMLNDDKTELMPIGTRQQLQKVNLNDITVGDTVVEAKSVVRNLGLREPDGRLTTSVYRRPTHTDQYLA